MREKEGRVTPKRHRVISRGFGNSFKLPRAVARRRKLRQSTDRESLCFETVSLLCWHGGRAWLGRHADTLLGQWATHSVGRGQETGSVCLCHGQENERRLGRRGWLPRFAGLIVFGDRRWLDARRAGTGRPAGLELGKRKLEGGRQRRRRRWTAKRTRTGIVCQAPVRGRARLRQRSSPSSASLPSSSRASVCIPT